MRVSVVMIAVAKAFSASASSPRPATTAGTAATSFSTGSGTPMIPVDEGMMNCGAASSAAPSAAQLCSATTIPEAPVAQFALPALTSTARTRPLFLRRCARPTSTGAAATRLRVNIAAATCAQRSLRQRNVAASACLDAGLGGRPEKSQGKKYRFVRSVQIHFSSFTSGCPRRSCSFAGRGRIANCGNSPRYIAISSHSCSLGQFAQSL